MLARLIMPLWWPGPPASKTRVAFEHGRGRPCGFAAHAEADAWVINANCPTCGAVVQLCQMPSSAGSRSSPGPHDMLIGDEDQAADELEARRTAGHTVRLQAAIGQLGRPRPKKSPGSERHLTRRTIDRRHADRCEALSAAYRFNLSNFRHIHHVAFAHR